MMRKYEISNPNSCLNKAEDDEPIFVLRANDELAPALVRQWATWYKNTKQDLGEFTPEREKKYREALDLAEMMRRWKHGR